ncbi:unnamed protein product [Didymodactylos carnosus]|uniref:Uncharacterized protein n=1 Tax=Didymodactylos carnosus TaxID=1234261 RepID=A0A814NTZ2_9BILA|nr:unnamed protein product [Didymodactylos carnosus]CAF1567715.1 unnamed protein product [Didymodactylos carnosus]CAF3862479.1 unnamed protein product [Didymodactylos carnosus]CAF4361253.1 unnamed protein product [Didymodactylos carnosus]
MSKKCLHAMRFLLKKFKKVMCLRKKASLGQSVTTNDTDETLSKIPTVQESLDFSGTKGACVSEWLPTSPEPHNLSSVTESKSSAVASNILQAKLMFLTDPVTNQVFSLPLSIFMRVKRRSATAAEKKEATHPQYLLYELVTNLFTHDEIQKCSLDGKVKQSLAFPSERMRAIDDQLSHLYGVFYSMYRDSFGLSVAFREKTR